VGGCFDCEKDDCWLIGKKKGAGGRLQKKKTQTRSTKKIKFRQAQKKKKGARADCEKVLASEQEAQKKRLLSFYVK